MKKLIFNSGLFWVLSVVSLSSLRANSAIIYSFKLWLASEVFLSNPPLFIYEFQRNTVSTYPLPPANNKFERYLPYNYTGQNFSIAYQLTY